MKKLQLIIVVLIFCSATLSLGGNTVGYLIPVSGLGDQSFNDMTYAGIIQAKNEYQFNLIREQCEYFSIASRKKSMGRLLAKGADIIVANGWEFQDVVAEYASLNPSHFFLINDIPLTGKKNVASTVFGQHEGSFLAGALAGWMTESGKIGIIGGLDMPIIQAFHTGFKEGATYARDNIEIIEVFLETHEDATSGFNNPGLAFTTANDLYDQGVDIIFGVAGLSGNGIIRAAASRRKFVIGVDADQDHMAQGYVLTSVMKRLDKATFSVLKKIFEGEFKPGIHYFGLKDGGVGLSPMTYTKHLIPANVLTRLEEVQRKIIDGEIIVTDYLQDSL